MIKKLGKGIVLSLAILALLQTTIFQSIIYANDAPVAISENAGDIFSLRTAISDNATTRKFVVTNQSNTAIDISYSTSLDSTHKSISVGANASADIVVAVGNATSVRIDTQYGGRFKSMNSYDAYNIVINYYANGGIIQSTPSVITKEQGVLAWNAPKKLSANGTSYVISGNDYKTVAFGATELSFQYNVEVKTPFKSYVNYVDQSGTRLNAERAIGFMVGENGAIFTPSSSYVAANGNSYSLISGQSDVSQTYEQGSQTYTYRYQKDEVARPYLITVIYKNTNGDVLNTKTLSVAKDATIEHETVATLSGVNGVEYQRSQGEASVIRHNYNDTQRTYTVLYQAIQATKPYDIRVQHIDLLSGRVLKTTSKTVDVNKTVRFNVESTMQQEGVSYVLSENQNAEITHVFGSEQRMYSVYFNEVGKTVASYSVDVLYFDVTNNKALYSEKEESIAGTALRIEAPSNYSAGGKEYVLLSGQGTMTHEFFSTRRKYVIFYRDVKDKENEDTVVENGANGTQTVVNPNATGPIINVDQNGDVTIPNGGPNGGDLVVDEDNNVVVKDEETPLSKGNKKKNSTMNTAIYTSIAGVSVIGLMLLFLYLKKRKTASNQVK